MLLITASPGAGAHHPSQQRRHRPCHRSPCALLAGGPEPLHRARSRSALGGHRVGEGACGVSLSVVCPCPWCVRVPEGQQLLRVSPQLCRPQDTASGTGSLLLWDWGEPPCAPAFLANLRIFLKAAAALPLRGGAQSCSWAGCPQVLCVLISQCSELVLPHHTRNDGKWVLKFCDSACTNHQLKTP